VCDKFPKLSYGKITEITVIRRATAATLKMLQTGRLLAYHFVGSHSEEICHERGKPWRQAALSDEAQLEFSQADCIVSALPVPARYIQQVRLRAAHATHAHVPFASSLINQIFLISLPLSDKNRKLCKVYK